MGAKNENFRRRTSSEGSKKQKKKFKVEPNMHEKIFEWKFESLVQFLHKPTNPKSLGVLRALFG